tara:strand:+ start:5709 stop:6401 length:693 start_codon:yes stop_codon:yes gene_type:complete
MSTVIPDTDILTGCTESHLIVLADGHAIHRQMKSAWQAMQQAAAKSGIDIRILSAFRSFQRQAAIWQQKCNGTRPVYDLAQQPVAITQLAGLAKLQAIMLYSALPGASRHHWGTDIDVYDAAAVPTDYQPQLLAAEYQSEGPFARLDRWLSTEAIKYGFFRPYQRYQGGVAAEPWHLSYTPIARPYMQALSVQALQHCLTQHPVAEQQSVLANLPYLYQTYVINCCEETE